MPKNSRVSEWYFVMVNPIIMVTIIVGFYLSFMAWLDPNNISSIFGPLGELATWLGLNYNQLMMIINVAAVACHILETVVAAYMCQKLELHIVITIAWIFQTLLFGGFSLKFLLYPQEESVNNSKKSI